MKRNKLVELMRRNSAFYRIKDELDYIRVVKSELSELEKAIKYETKESISDELGDVLFQTVMLYNKILEKYSIRPSKMYKTLIRKYKSRAPHIFTGEYKTLAEEDKVWFETKNNGK